MGVKKLSWVLAVLVLGAFTALVYFAATTRAGFIVAMSLVALVPIGIVLKCLQESFLRFLLAPKVEEIRGLVKGDAEVTGDPALHRAVPQEAEDAP